MYKPISKKQLARVAGIIYLGIVLTGIFTMMYIPSQLFATDNKEQIVQNIRIHESLFRLGIAGGLLCYLLFLLLPLVLYKLLSKVNKNIAILMVFFATMSVPVYYLNAAHQLSVLSLLNDGRLLDYSTQIMNELMAYNNGMRIVHIFSGLWLLPFGYLVFKSGFLPKIFGILLMLGCFGYLINFGGNLLITGYSSLGISSYISLPASVGEIGICLWLLIIGIRETNSSNNKA